MDFRVASRPQEWLTNCFFAPHSFQMSSFLKERNKTIHAKLKVETFKTTVADLWLLDQVAALLFYGRRDRFKILNTYLERDLLSAGGILREVAPMIQVLVEFVTDLSYILWIGNRKDAWVSPSEEWIVAFWCDNVQKLCMHTALGWSRIHLYAKMWSSLSYPCRP